MDFYRYHGLGNDYLVIDPRETSVPITEATVRLICDRHFGVGSDGILYGPLPEDAGPAALRVRIFNPDGSEAEKSGNGTRIFARYLVDAGDRRQRERFSIHTLGGEVTALVHDPAESIEMGMGTATFHSSSIPVNGPPREVVDESLSVGGRPVRVTAVGIGNPHAVVPVARATPALAHDLGPRLETHGAFPNRTNVQVLEVLDRSTIRIEIWERGAGYTLASGTSASAAAAAAVKLGLVNRRVTVRMPGGQLTVVVGHDFSVTLTGPVEAVSSGYLAADLLRRLEKLAAGASPNP
jgi:diaminopimelate epimerase